MSSVFVTSQSSCFFLCSREQIRLVENRLECMCPHDHTGKLKNLLDSGGIREPVIFGLEKMKLPIFA
jgi:hypothetical protein